MASKLSMLELRGASTITAVLDVAPKIFDVVIAGGFDVLRGSCFFLELQL